MQLLLFFNYIVKNNIRGDYLNRINHIKNYDIYQAGNEYIIHNNRKEFSEGHTHIRNYKTAIFIVKLAIHKSMPHHLYKYFIVSLSRITDDENYKTKLLEFINNTSKKQTYANRGNYNKCKNKKF